MKVLHVFTIILTPKSFFDGQFRYLSENGHEIHVASSSNEDFEFSNRNQLFYHQINISRSISPITDIKAIGLLIRLINQERFDVVVGHTPKGALVAMIASFLARTKNRIYFRHGLIYTTSTGIKRFIFKMIERLTSLLSTNIINVSNSLSAWAVKDKLNSGSKQVVIGSGTCGGIDTVNTFNQELVDVEKLISIRTSLGIGTDDFVIGFCGRLCKDKGIIEIVQAYQKFRSANKSFSVKLLLVGRFDERDILPEDCVSLMNTDPNIITTGHIPQNELPFYYSLMDLFVFPSYREGFGMCVIEASAMNVPVLVSHSHGCEDALIDGVTGEYIKIDACDISKKLMSLYNNPFKRAEYGRNGRKWVCENFERTKLWPKYLNFYENLGER